MALEGWIILLAIIGATISFYTALQQKFSRLFAFCFTHSKKRVDCREILHSSYARIFIVPNSWLGIMTYITIATIYYYAQTFSVLGASRLYYVGLAIAVLGWIFSMYLLGVQKFKLKKYCIFCLTSSIIMTTIFVLSAILVFF